MQGFFTELMVVRLPATSIVTIILVYTRRRWRWWTIPPWWWAVAWLRCAVHRRWWAIVPNPVRTLGLISPLDSISGFTLHSHNLFFDYHSFANGIRNNNCSWFYRRSNCNRFGSYGPNVTQPVFATDFV